MYNTYVMGTEIEPKEMLLLAAFRMPQWLRDEARDKCHRDDITFSQLMRRALRRELNVQFIPQQVHL